MNTTNESVYYKVSYFFSANGKVQLSERHIRSCENCSILLCWCGPFTTTPLHREIAPFSSIHQHYFTNRALHWRKGTTAVTRLLLPGPSSLASAWPTTTVAVPLWAFGDYPWLGETLVDKQNEIIFTYLWHA